MKAAVLVLAGLAAPVLSRTVGSIQASKKIASLTERFRISGLTFV